MEGGRYGGRKEGREGGRKVWREGGRGYPTTRWIDTALVYHAGAMGTLAWRDIDMGVEGMTGGNWN